jgi:hypothetical protein
MRTILVLGVTLLFLAACGFNVGTSAKLPFTPDVIGGEVEVSVDPTGESGLTLTNTGTVLSSPEE